MLLRTNAIARMTSATGRVLIYVGAVPPWAPRVAWRGAPTPTDGHPYSFVKLGHYPGTDGSAVV